MFSILWHRRLCDTGLGKGFLNVLNEHKKKGASLMCAHSLLEGTGLTCVKKNSCTAHTFDVYATQRKLTT